ncbi:Spo0E family sporulation regulatory protein-aspartic acid phosphatase [Actinomycetes bacterium NPDC127524]|uniref:aspartyl-phosphate phosphatase Spo0E family protein n=1 Tax=Bacillus sp. MUM 13 TaxID=1678001 RepID=UPI0009F689E6|nr:aspartyl-phosphate phosphatase Spo0E family protein [Bacillus sp. MUM 13]
MLQKNEITSMIDSIRQKMISSANTLGLASPETIKLSQELDEYIAAYQFQNKQN